MSRQARQTDIELLEAVQAGSTAAYGVLYQRHVGAARSLARQLVQGEDEVEEVLVETFARVLDMIRCDGGPACAFRPYLLMAIRRYLAIGEVDLAHPGHVHVDPELAGLERSAIARAYLALPEQWQMVLWHAEIEGTGLGEIGSFLNLSAKGTAALVAQARAGLRQAYLRLHEDAGPDEECRPVLPKIVQYVEGGLPKRDAGGVDEHVAGCIDCRSVYLELADVTQGLRAIVGPLVAGPAVDDYLADLAAAGDGVGVEPRGVPVLSRLPTPYRAVMAGAAAAALTLGMFLLVSGPAVKKPLARGESALLPYPASGSPAGTPAAESDASLSAATGTAGSQATGSQATGSQATGSQAVGSQVTGSQAVGSQTAGSQAVGSQTTGSQTTGSQTTGSQTTGSQTTGTRAREDRPARVLGKPGRAAPPVTRQQVRRQTSPTARTGPTNPREPGATRPALVASIAPLGALVPARPGIVALRLRNPGTAAGQGVTATVRLPRGVTPTDSGTRDGWTCRTAGQRVRCAHPGLASGEKSTLFLPVNVAADAPKGEGLGASVRSGSLETVAKSDSGVRDAGAAARFAATGRVLTRTIGNALLGRVARRPDCAPADSGEPRAGGPGVAVPVDLDDDPVTRTSSCARLDLPTGSRVLWAGLYWSAIGQESARNTGDARASGASQRSDSGRAVRVRPPGAPSYRTIEATEVTHRDRRTGYQAFADVTPMVREARGGRWWVADAPTGPGAARQAGWSLVVVAEDRRQPYGTATVLDAASVGSGEMTKIPLDGLAADTAPARVDLVLWNATGAGDGVATLSDRSRVGAGHRGRRTGVSAVAVDTFQTLLGRHPVLRLKTRREGLLFGVAAITTHTWS
ncbi:hypothetical protein ACFHYQ_22745 [Sphaerimonospora cavernae]|uniref:RNA polymerase sigma factor (Sigma-70 family) n=1 Tax=Sphaerimonospora cavernae TaxID=1740611 RepID=A0ABV6UA95_9ACTN